MPQQQLQRLLDEFSRSHGIALKLENGVCALQDTQGQEALVLELPPGSDALLLHCQLFPMSAYGEKLTAWRLMMTLNFEINAMRGCWLALDEEEQVRLCNQQTLATLDSVSFNDTLLAFMQQAREARVLLLEMFAAL
ncbi:type III secretion system chaperone [Erwinia sp. V71]|uniref:type III secretion system chaperone n=1 Tax=Erwinia sp. V71 TaxID=3369424 RepID=UPI003F5FDC38